MPTKAELNERLKEAKQRLQHRQEHLAHWRKWHPDDKETIKKYADEYVPETQATIRHLETALASLVPNVASPKLVGWEKSGLKPANVFGSLGPETKVTTHYAASPRAHNLAEGLALARGFDAFHRSKGWGGVSYHFLIPDTGEIILGRSTLHKGAHVLNTNTGNVGINFFCTAGDKPTKAQAKTYLWLLAHAHTDALPARHRTDRDLRNADIRGHKFWPGQSTDCPGFFTPAALKELGS